MNSAEIIHLAALIPRKHPKAISKGVLQLCSPKNFFTRTGRLLAKPGLIYSRHLRKRCETLKSLFLDRNACLLKTNEEDTRDFQQNFNGVEGDNGIHRLC